MEDAPLKAPKTPRMAVTEADLTTLAEILASHVTQCAEHLAARKMPSHDLHDLAEVSEQSHRLAKRFAGRVKARQKARAEWDRLMMYRIPPEDGRKEPELPHEPFTVKVSGTEAAHILRTIRRPVATQKEANARRYARAERLVREHEETQKNAH